jgi:hypothetical protein
MNKRKIIKFSDSIVVRFWLNIVFNYDYKTGIDFFFAKAMGELAL